jgi:hypothetical protein
MNWNEWEMIWRRQQTPAGAGADLRLLKQTFEGQRRKLRRKILVRNVSEGATGLALFALLAFIGAHAGVGGWRMWTGLSLLLGVSLVFVFDILRAHRSRIPGGATILAKIDAEIAELRHQRRLLARVGLWYFLPMAASFVLIVSAWVARIGREIPPGMLLDAVLHDTVNTPRIIIWLILTLAITGGATVWIWRVQVKSIRTRVNARLEELKKLREDLLGRVFKITE